MDEATGFCRGCARTADEIADWRDQSDQGRGQIWADLPGRFEQLGIVMRRLPWSAAETLDFVEESIHESKGVWVLGVYGAVGEFMRDFDEDYTLTRHDNAVETWTERGAMRLRFGDEVRALAVANPKSGAAPPRILLALQRSKPRLGIANSLTALGPDEDAVHGKDRQSPLFDFGLGRAIARFSVRPQREAELSNLLASSVGIPWPDHLTKVGAQVVATSPTRVIETGLGRVEINAPIPRSGETSPPGPHTHLLPDHLETGRDTQPGMDLPDSHAVGAVFYPNDG